MLTEFPPDALLLSRRPDPDHPFCEIARIIQKYIPKLERPAMPHGEHPFCQAYNDDVEVALACIAAIRWEMSGNVLGDSKLPRAIHSRLASIGVPLLEWCLWLLKDMSFEFTECPMHNTTRIDAATGALVVLSAFISDPKGLQLVPSYQEVVDIVVHAWASVAGLAYGRDAILPVMLLLDKLHKTPQLHDLVVESLRQYMPALPLQIIRHVAAFSHRDLEPLPDPSLERLPVECHIRLMIQLLKILPSECGTLYIDHNAPKWVCRAFARALTIPFKDWQGGEEVLMNPFRVILMFFKYSFELDSSLISMKAALRHKLVESLVRCLSEVSRQKRLGQSIQDENFGSVFDAVAQLVFFGIMDSGTILRLACIAMDSLDLVEEEKWRFCCKDQESIMAWAAWSGLKNGIAKNRKKWVVDPNAQSGGRCMNPQCAEPYARRLRRCADCQHLVVCSRACQKYMWTTLDHRSKCFNFARCYSAVVENDERHYDADCPCQRFTLI